MKEYRPTDDFVSRVMDDVHRYESLPSISKKYTDTIFGSRLFRYAMSGGGIFAGIFLVPVACI